MDGNEVGFLLLAAGCAVGPAVRTGILVGKAVGFDVGDTVGFLRFVGNEVGCCLVGARLGPEGATVGLWEGLDVG